jgi:hypothetical protein
VDSTECKINKIKLFADREGTKELVNPLIEYQPNYELAVNNALPG